MLLQAIQGKAAGVQVVSSDLPGSAPSVVLEVWVQHWARTYATLHSRWMPTENINNINTNDITSYEILKDASGPFMGRERPTG
jgi:hypothetical protein